MRILRVRFRTNRELLEAWHDDQPQGGLFCPTTAPIQAGADVLCELSIPAIPNKVLIRGRVVSWRPALPRQRRRAGALIAWVEDEATKAAFVIETVRGERPAPARRRHLRLPVAMSVRWKPDGEPHYQPADLSEISEGGALLRADLPIPLGTELVVEVTPPGAVTTIAIAGTAAYHTPRQATGIRFHYRDGGGSRRLRELVRRFRIA